MARDVHRGSAAVGGHDPDVAVEVVVVLAERDVPAVRAPACIDREVEAAPQVLLLAGGDVTHHQRAEVAAIDDLLAVRRWVRRAFADVRQGDEGLDLHLDRVGPAGAFVLLVFLLVALLRFVLLGLILLGVVSRLLLLRLRGIGPGSGRRRRGGGRIRGRCGRRLGSLRLRCLGLLGLRFVPLLLCLRLFLLRIHLLLERAADLAARLRHRGLVDGIVAVHVAREEELGTVRHPDHVALARGRAGDAHEGRALVDTLHVDVAVGDDGHGLAVGRELRLGHVAAHGARAHAVGLVLGALHHHLHRLRAGGGQVQPPERIPHAEQRGLAVHGDRQVTDVVVERGELRAPLGRCCRERLAPQVDALAVAAVGQVDDVASGRERPAVVALPVGVLREAAGAAVEAVDVALVRALVAAAHPRAGAALHDHRLAVARGQRMRGERIAHALHRAARERHHVRARRAEEVVLARGLEVGHGATGAVDARAGKQRHRIAEGELAHAAAVALHHVEVAAAVAVAVEDDRRTVGAERRAALVGRIRRQADGAAAGDRALPDIAAPAEDRHRAVRAQRRVPGKVHGAGEGAQGGDGQRKAGNDGGGGLHGRLLGLPGASGGGKGVVHGQRSKCASCPLARIWPFQPKICARELARAFPEFEIQGVGR